MKATSEPLREADADGKIVALLERLSRLFRLLLSEEGQPRGLSPVQIRILVHLLSHGASLRRAGRLAREFQLTPATVSQAVSTLVAKGLVRKTRSPSDGRVTILDLTEEGEQAARSLSGWTDAVRRHVEELPEEDKRAAMRFLMQLAGSLQQAGLIAVARMCVTCRFFGENESGRRGAPHFCHLLEKPLAERELRVDCAEHAPREDPPRR